MARNVGNQRGNAHTDLNAAVREANAFRLRAEGKSFEEIAQLLGYIANGKPNRSAAYKAYRRALHAIPKETVEEMRQNILEQQRIAFVGLYGKITRGDTFAIREMTGMHDRQSKLFGLDTPVADIGLASNYTKRVVLCDDSDALPDLLEMESEATE